MTHSALKQKGCSGSHPKQPQTALKRDNFIPVIADDFKKISSYITATTAQFLKAFNAIDPPQFVVGVAVIQAFFMVLFWLVTSK